MITLASLALLVACVFAEVARRRLDAAAGLAARARRDLLAAVLLVDRAERLAAANAARYERIGDTISTN